MTHVLAKIGGWAQFALTLLTQFASNQPHGWAQWLVAGTSAVTAIAIHASANTDGTK